MLLFGFLRGEGGNRLGPKTRLAHDAYALGYGRVVSRKMLCAD